MQDNICFVFDFDLTLSDSHTGGDPKINIEYISKKQVEIVLQGMMNIIKNNKMNKIIILTRTPEERISFYLKTNYNKLYCLVDIIYGPVLEEFKRNFDEEYWAQWKVKKLKNIEHIYPNDKIIFFDDTLANIREALSNGIRSFHIQVPGYIGTAINNAIDMCDKNHDNEHNTPT